jgi:O-Antigen ligase
MAITNRAQIGRTTRFLNRGSRTNTARPITNTGRPNPIVAWLILVGIFTPYIQMDIGGLVFTPARLTATIFFLPAIVILLKSGRNWKSPDFFAIATAGWIIIASFFNEGFQAYVGAQALEFLGAYLMGRAFFFGRPGLELFNRIFKAVAFVVILLGFLDTLAGYPVTLTLLGLTQFQVDYRNGVLRADSVFSVAELFGTFCVVATVLFWYCERNTTTRIFFVVLSICGTVASLSSGPLLGLVISLAVFSYDAILNKIVWRWKLLVMGVLGLILAAYLYSNDPIAAIVGHLTLNPETGNFRINTWTLGLDLVSEHPIVGRGLASLEDASDLVKLFVGQSVDALWLVLMLRYGVPVVVLLLLTIFIPMFGTYRSANDPYLTRARTGFSLAVILMAVIGITVHYWDAIWIFFGICIGIRASFVELEARDGNLRRRQ